MGGSGSRRIGSERRSASVRAEVQRVPTVRRCCASGGIPRSLAPPVARSFLSGTEFEAGAVYAGKFSVCGRGPCSREFFLPEGLSRSDRTSAPSGVRTRFGWSAGYVVGLRSRRAPLGGYATPFGECERPSRFGPLSRGTSSRGGRSVVLRRGQGPGERALRSENLTI